MGLTSRVSRRDDSSHQQRAGGLHGRQPTARYSASVNDKTAHWEGVYGRKKPDGVSWYRAHLERSLAFVDRAGLSPTSRIIDVGGGASTLVDDLLDRGFSNVTVLDISPASLDAARRRLGERAAGVEWLVGDITEVELPPGSFDFWHDRAVFHFLRQPAERQRYVAAVRHALRPGGNIVVATFGPHGPERCSGLDVAHYSADELHDEFGAGFTKVDSTVEQHTTPAGGQQEFVYCYCRMS